MQTAMRSLKQRASKRAQFSGGSLMFTHGDVFSQRIYMHLSQGRSENFIRATAETFFFMCQAWQTSARNVAAGRPLACLAQKQPWCCTAAAESDDGGLTLRHAARTRLHLPLRNCPDARAAPRKPEHACRAALTRGLPPSHVAVLCGPPHCPAVLVADCCASLRILGWQVLQSEFAFFNSYSLKFQMRGSRPTFGEPESL